MKSAVVLCFVKSWRHQFLNMKRGTSSKLVIVQISKERNNLFLCLFFFGFTMDSTYRIYCFNLTNFATMFHWNIYFNSELYLKTWVDYIKLLFSTAKEYHAMSLIFINFKLIERNLKRCLTRNWFNVIVHCTLFGWARNAQF